MVSSPDLAALVGQLRRSGSVFAEDEARLLIETAADSRQLELMVQQRIAGLPLEQVLGWAEFGGLRIRVEPGVFVPRRRTELLATLAIGCMRRARPHPPVMVELCCGSGAVAAVVAAAVSPAELYAADIDPIAVRCARHNLGSSGTVLEGDLYAPLPTGLRGRVDVLVANAPYVPTDQIELMPSEARSHEPRSALDGGPDGLDVVRRIIAGAAEWLAPSGTLLVESSEPQVPEVLCALRSVPLTARVARSEEKGAVAIVSVRDAAR